MGRPAPTALRLIRRRHPLRRPHPPRGWGLTAVAGFALVGFACSADPPAPAATITAEIAVDPSPGAAIAADGDGVWVVASTSFTDPGRDDPRHAVVRIDPRREAVDVVTPVEHPMTALALGEGAVWAVGTRFGPDDTEPAGALVRLDPSGGAVTHTLDLGRGSPSDVVVGFGSVWVSDSTADTVFEIDPGRVEVTHRIAVGGGPTSLAVAAGRLWVTKPGEGEVRPLDPQTRTPLPALAAGSVPSVLGAGPAGLWVADYHANELSLLDPEEQRTGRTVRFDTAPSRFAVTGEGVVVVESEGRRVSAVEAGGGGSVTLLLDERFAVDVAVVGGTAWIVDHGTDTVLRVALPTSE